MMNGCTPTERPHATLKHVLRAGAFGAVALLLAAACDRPVTAPVVAPPNAGGPAFDVGASGGSAAVNQELAALRELTAPFQDFQTAQAAGWNQPVLDCLDNPPEGGMGFHFANPEFMNDTTPKVLRPQLLMYEPEQNGRMRLVGVEYIISFANASGDGPPPQLFGHAFHPNTDLGIWGLHAWVWKHNPSGMFADWNPTVSCQYAP